MRIWTPLLPHIFQVNATTGHSNQTSNAKELDWEFGSDSEEIEPLYVRPRALPRNTKKSQTNVATLIRAVPNGLLMCSYSLHAIAGA